jgi:hypothetical protein
LRSLPSSSEVARANWHNSLLDHPITTVRVIFQWGTATEFLAVPQHLRNLQLSAPIKTNVIAAAFAKLSAAVEVVSQLKLLPPLGIHRAGLNLEAFHLIWSPVIIVSPKLEKMHALNYLLFGRKQLRKPITRLVDMLDFQPSESQTA